MKAISLWQPWASAMALGWKKNETRHWSTKHRGPLLIHAAKKVIGWPSLDIQSMFDEIAFQPSDLPRGVILCKVDLVDCQKTFIHNRPRGVEGIFGDYTPGRFMWITEKIEVFNDPIPFKGSQGFFNVPEDLLNIANHALEQTEKQIPLFS